MATTSSTGGLGANGTNLVDKTKLTAQRDAYEDMNMESFIKLMVTEMQNQDPLNPMDNAQMLQQLSSMQSINSTKKLTTTLDAVLLGQNLSNAGSLIGKTINGLTADGEEVTGKVEQATLVGNVPYLNVGDKAVPIGNVRYIMPEGSEVVDNPDDPGDDTTTDET